MAVRNSTFRTTVVIPPEILKAVREKNADLADVPTGLLVRAGLLILAGNDTESAITAARMTTARKDLM
jgi:hypothetical protein